MNKKTMKILAILFIICISIPVIAVATTDQQELLSIFKKEESQLYNEKISTNSLSITDLSKKVFEVERIPEDKYNINGKWGIFNRGNEGTFKGFENKNEICGKGWYKNEKVYFYIQLSKLLGTFSGIVIYKDNFHSINGNYIKKNGKYVALWKVEGIEGWFAGEML